MSGIQVKNLGKAYKQYRGRWSRFLEWVVPHSRIRHKLIWVLRGIDFEVHAGEAVALIGMNGAGKSTLLRMITGTALPTEGEVKIKGSIAALLELGIGFHPEFTGRQNVYMAGQLMGLSLEQIHQLMPSVEAFAEIGDYIDQPTRVYSSGMQMRLAFSIATANRPDVLIVDEALSVGDAYFQHKSFDRIRAFREQGTTLLIVSHDKQAIQSICDRAILLRDGKVAMQGSPESVLDFYSALLSEHHNQGISQTTRPDGRIETISGGGQATIENVCLFSGDERTELLRVGESVRLEITVKVNQKIPSLVLGCGIKDRFGQMMFGTNTYHTNQMIDAPESGSTYVFSVEFQANLGVGSYSVHLSLVKEYSHIDMNYQWRDNAFVFEVVNLDKYEFVGSMWNEMKFKYRIVS
jgi:lipopolysaccharide transport system ATP-binding protein